MASRAPDLDAAVQNLIADVPSPHSARLAAAKAGLEQAYTHLREALICSAVDFRQPGSGKQALAMRERYPVLPHRSQLPQDTPVNHAPRLADASFPPNSVIEAIVQPAPYTAAPSRTAPIQRQQGEITR